MYNYTGNTKRIKDFIMRFILFLLIFSIPLLAETDLQKELPIGLTEDELQNLHIINEMGRETDPPQYPVRNIAEFEPMQGVLIRYPFGISTSFIREMAEDVIIYCLVSSSQQNSAYNSMSNAGVDMSQVEFIVGSTDSYWTRDYGPWWVVDGNNDVSVVDHTYNRPRPNDNQAPQKMSDYLSTPYFASDIITAGGNYMTDGYTIGASSNLIYEENPDLTDSQVNQIMLDYYGISNYMGIDDPNNTYIDHIDCWGKFLSPSKVLIRSVQNSHAQYDEIEEVAELFANSLNTFGEPWEVFRVYTPQNQPYSNSLILNKKVFVPIMNSSYDDDALASYEEAMPGYEIIGVTGSWQSTDALHCRTKGIPDLEMLQIFHNPINDQDNPQENFEVQAIINDLSQAGLIFDELKVFWKNQTMDDYESINLDYCVDDIPNCYVALLPNQTEDGNVQYFIQAIDLTGRVENLPMAGYFDFDVVGGLPTQQGDVNQDSALNVLDIVQIVNNILGTNEFSEYQMQLADMNSDNIVNILDVILLVNIIIGD
jgi:agmatine/peptidylarginine deiminase